MKNKIYTLFVLLISFCFLSCSNLLEEREINNSTSDTYVSFNFGNERAIVSTATPVDYTYTLKGTSNEETLTLCEKLAYADFISKHFRLTHGEWTFEITAYKNNIAVFGGSVTQTLVEGNNNVSFTLRAVTGGTGSLSITLNYPSSADVKTILAGLYDSIPSSIPDVASAPAGCTVFSPEASASSVTFECASIPSGVNKFVEFFIYDSNNVFIGSYLESVFLISGDTFELEKTLSTVNSFSATVYLTVQGQPWNNSGSKFKAVKAGKEYLLQTGNNTNAYIANLPLGTYDIYNSIVDTGIDLTVRTNNSSNITVNYDSAIRYATAEDICDVIDSLTEETTTVCVIGDFSEDNFPSLRSAISTQYSNKPNCKFVLDLQQVSNLTTIPNDALLGCWSLIEVKLPDSVITIGEDAFAGCPYLEAIEIPSSVTSLGVEALGHCIRLETVEIQSSVTEIPDYAFQNCASLSSIEIPSSVTTIGRAAFRGCMQLKSIEIPSLVTSIGREAFSGCRGLESMEIPSSVTTIAERAFESCSTLKSIEIPSSVTTIADSAFASCSNLKSIEIPSSVTSIGKLAFEWCSKLQTINYVGTEEEWNAMQRSPDWNGNAPSDMVINYLKVNATVDTFADVISSLTSDKTIVMSGQLTNNDITNIKSAINNSEHDIKVTLDLRNITNLTALPNNAFKDCTKLSGIMLPDSVTSLGRYAFSGCTSLESIEIPDSVTSLGDWAFSGCTGLKSIEIPDSVLSIPGRFLDGCTSLESIEIPSSVTSISDSAFLGCSSLKSLVIPDSVTSIGSSAFSRCTSLESIELPDTITSINSYTISGCTSLESITIPNSVTSISNDAFSGCSSLKSITIPNSVTYIGDYAFNNCKNLKSIVIPDSLESTGSFVFFQCKILSTINYTGTEEQWNAINKGYEWNAFCPPMVINYNYQAE